MGFNGRPGRQKRQRNREMLDLWAGSDFTYKQIARLYGLSANRTRVIIVNQLRRDRMEAAGRQEEKGPREAKGQQDGREAGNQREEQEGQDNVQGID